MGIIVRQSLKGTIVNYVGVVLGIFVQFYVVAKYLDPEVIGLTKVIYEVAMLCSAFALLSCNAVAMRFFPYFRDEKNHNNGFFFFYLLLPVVGTILMTGVYCLCRGPVTDFFGKNSALFNDFFYWVIPLMAVLTFWQFFEGYSNINMRIAVPKTVREIGMRLFMLALYLLYGLRYLDVAGLVAGFVVCYGMCMAMTGTYALHIGDNSLKHDWKFLTPDLRSQILKYLGFLLLSTMSAGIMAQLDLFMLSGVRGLYAGGIYTIVLYMAAVVEMPTRSITSISGPLAARALKEGNQAEVNCLYRQVSVHQTLASAFLLVFVWISLDAIYEIIPNGDKYAEGRMAVLFLGLAKVFNSAINFGNTLISFSKYYYWTLFIAIFITLLSIGTNLYFIPRMGISGAALATLIATLISGGYQQYLVQVKIKSNPFSRAHLSILMILVVMLLVDWLIPSLCTVSPWLDIAVRTPAVALVGLTLTYWLRVSDTINRMIDRVLVHVGPAKH